MAETSTAKLRPYAGGGSGPRGSSSRRVSVLFFRALVFSRAFGKSCQNVPAHFDDFPLKASARDLV